VTPFHVGLRLGIRARGMVLVKGSLLPERSPHERSPKVIEIV
jgi:hypothetical protein